MFERFSDVARQALVDATELARRSAGSSVQFTHLLVALARADRELRERIERTGVIVDHLEKSVPVGDGFASDVHLAWSDPVKEALEAAWLRGRSRRPQVVTPADLVAAIAASRDSGAAEFLERMGLPASVLVEYPDPMTSPQPER